MYVPEGLLPIAGLVRKELVTLLRARWVNGLFLLFFSTAWLLLFVGIADLPGYALQVNRLADTVRDLMYFVTILVMGSISFFVATTSATAVLQEIHHNTVEMVSVTLIRPWQFLLAKLISTVGLAMLLTLSFMPMAAIGNFGVGVNAGYIAELLLAAATSSLTMGCVGLVAGTYLRRITFANIASLAVSALIVVGYPCLPIALYSALYGGALRSVFEDVAWVTSPTIRLARLLEGSAPGTWSTNWQSPLYFTAFMLFQAFVLFLIAWCRMERIWISPMSEIPRGILTRASGVGRWRVQERPELEVIPDGMNPVWFVESRVNSRLMGIGGWRIFFWSCFANGLMFLASLWLPRSVATLFVWGLTLIVVVPFAMPAFAAPLFARELETDTHTDLRMSLISSARIYFARARVLFAWLAVLLTPVLIFQVISVIAGMKYYASESDFSSRDHLLRMGVILSISYAILFTGSVFHSLYAAVRFRSTMLAFVLGELLITATGVGICFVLVIATSIMGNMQLAERNLLWLFPFATTFEVMEPTVPNSRDYDDWVSSIFYVCVLSTIYAFRGYAMCLNRYARPER